MLMHTSWERFRFFRSWVGFEHAYYKLKSEAVVGLHGGLRA